MEHCAAKALLLVTATVEGTSTSIARERHHLRCSLDVGHPGPHRDEAHEQSWEGALEHCPTLLVHDEEAGE
jgi:hypothetical protein